MNNEKIVFRKARKVKLGPVFQNIRKYFGEEAIVILQKRCLWIKDGNISEVFAITPSIETIIETLPQVTYFAGIPIGSLKGGKFQLEVEGSLLMLSATKKVIQVKTDQFLYGKAIFKENIIDSDAKFQKGDLVIVVGKNQIHYGIGEATLNSDEINQAPSNTVVVYGNKNIPRDRGWYLRKGN